MSKILQQQLYSNTVYGSENANGTLRLEASSSALKGAVQAVGSSLELVIAAAVARITHSNTSLRTYTLPDKSGEILVAGRFASVGDMFYGGTSGTAQVLTSVPRAALTTSMAGVPQWIVGEAGQVLAIDPVTLEPIFAALPDNGQIGLGEANSLSYYAASGNAVGSLPTASDRVLTSPSGVPTWALLTASYLRGATGLALANGSAGQLLTAAGNGSFQWTNPNPSLINSGRENAVSYYNSTDPVLSASGWLTMNEANRALELRNQGRVRFFEALANGTNFLEFRAPANLGPDTVWVLPSTDGAPGASLQTDGAGNLAFVDLGSVGFGNANQLSYYATAGNDVAALPTTAGRALVSSSSGTLSWGLISASYLSAGPATALSNGLADQVLVSNASGSFVWKTATTLTGEVLAGNVGYLSYYPATGRSVQGTSFVRVDHAAKNLILDQGSSLKFSSAAGSTTLTASSSVLGDLTFTLPSNYGVSGQALVTDGSQGLSFADIDRGMVLGSSVSGTLATYTGDLTPAGYGKVQPLANQPGKILRTDASGSLEWGLVDGSYLTVSGVPTDSVVLGVDNLGNLEWKNPTDITGEVLSGSANSVAFYPSDGTEVSDSSFIKTDETNKSFELRASGSLKFYEPTDTNYVELKAPTDLSAPLEFSLPDSDGTPGQVLVTDGSGNLSFAGIDVGIIGAAEDGTYTDGLFTDFTETTRIGTAVDRFNEILKALAPPPASPLSAISFTSAAGVSGKASFGLSNVVSGYTAVGTAAGGAALDINDSIVVSGNRRGIYAPQALSGAVAGGASAHAYAYPANSFGDGDKGTLSLEVNGSIVHTVDLSSFVSGSTVNANGSGFSLSAATPVKFQDGTSLDLFKYRTGTWTVSAANQRSGWNYMRVHHQIAVGVVRNTNYFEWVNDAEVTATTITGDVLRNLSLTGSKYLSGVQYYTGGSALYDTTISNAYRNTYSTSGTAISHPTMTNCTLVSSGLGAVSSHTASLSITGKVVTISPAVNNRILGGDLAVSTRVLRTVQAAVTGSTVSGGWRILLDASTASATNLTEDFRGEGFRQRSDLSLTSLSYGSGANNGPANWDSTSALTDGLLIYNGALRYPKQGLTGGDFRNTDDGNAIGPTVPGGYSGNPNYSNATGEKVYLRYFYTTTAKQNFTLNVSATSTTFVAASNRGSLTGNNVTIEILAPNITTDGSGNVVWKDCVTSYTTDSAVGAYAATYGASIPTSWGLTLGTKSTANSAFTVVIRITASQGWTGYISAITLSPI